MTHSSEEEILNGISELNGVCSFGTLSPYLLPCRAVSRIPGGCRSVFVFLFPYLLDADCYGELTISRYAAVPDYHDVVMKRLSRGCEKLSEIYPGECFVPFCDSSPFPEVSAAVSAGLGVKGKNGLLIHRDFGSFVFIGEIAATLERTPSSVSGSTVCSGCGRCIELCPGKALSEDGLNETLCLSGITQKKGTLSPEQEDLIIKNNCFWGCDVCQTVCPMNGKALIKPLAEFTADTVCGLSAENLQGRAFAWRGKKTIERNLSLENRNKEK